MTTKDMYGHYNTIRAAIVNVLGSAGRWSVGCWSPSLSRISVVPQKTRISGVSGGWRKGGRGGGGLVLPMSIGWIPNPAHITLAVTSMGLSGGGCGVWMCVADKCKYWMDTHHSNPTQYNASSLRSSSPRGLPAMLICAQTWHPVAESFMK